MLFPTPHAPPAGWLELCSDWSARILTRIHATEIPAVLSAGSTEPDWLESGDLGREAFQDQTIELALADKHDNYRICTIIIV